MIEIELGRGKLTRIDQCRKTRDKEKLISQVTKNRTDSKKPITKRVVEIYTDFEALCFNMSKADKINSVSDFKAMNTLDFYTYKHNLTKYLKPAQEE